VIEVNKPLLNGNEKRYLDECIETGWISSEGPFIKRFEEGIAGYVGRKYGIAVANGSAALDIAIRALSIKEGDEVIMPTFTIISPAQSIVISGAKPVLVDADPITWCMDVQKIEEKITRATKAILVVHIYGFPTYMEPVIALAEKYNLFIIEDAAEMHGQEYNGKKCGSFGHISTFSFYPNKHITTGEGGMIMTDDPVLAERCRSFRNLCFLPGRRFVHEELGWNYRMTNLQAALGVAQLEKIDEHIKRKREIGALYNKFFADETRIELMPEETRYAKNIYWVYAIISKSKPAAQLIESLAERGIATRPFFYPMHLQPVFKRKNWFKDEYYQVSEHISEFGFYLPSGLGIKDSEIKTVSDTLKQVL